MAAQAIFSPFSNRLSSLSSNSHHPRITNFAKPFLVRCLNSVQNIDSATIRRSANYVPSFWDYSFVKSLNSDYTEEKYAERYEKMKEEVRCLIRAAMEPLERLELIDAVQRLGLRYQFEIEIKNAVQNVVNQTSDQDALFHHDLHSTSLRFRILRQHGFHVPQEIFDRFKDESGHFKADLCNDVKGLLSLYEASFFGLEDENTIDDAKVFATKHLKDVNEAELAPLMARKVNHALDMPLHWRLNRVEARWFIDTYREETNKNLLLLEFAKLDFNMVQSIHQKEVRKLAGWDINEIDRLPENIKTCLLALFNTTNEIGYWTIREKGFNIIPYLSKVWATLCKAYRKEARWFHSGYKPTLKEYIDNAVVSIAAPIMLFYAYFLTTENISKEALDYIYDLPSIMRCSSMLLRLTNDLGTSSDELARGDIVKSIQCYMNDTGASEEIAREYINGLVHQTWKTLNKDMFRDYPFEEPFISACPNLGRTAQCFYQYGDGHGVPQHWTKDHLISLLVKPVPID
ncbi:Terpene synthase, N-terminal domain [Dillenia turbinata]|uniref:Terpene synthase, N-terminal domain n=1 Tax=Dillenia turbinata TaxID=194707 RepID=A0AAN8UPR4_9MAGN